MSSSTLQDELHKYSTWLKLYLIWYNTLVAMLNEQVLTVRKLISQKMLMKTILFQSSPVATHLASSAALSLD